MSTGTVNNVKNSPFKFLDPYGKEDKEIFFGRDKEIELLYETTFKTNLLLIYGQSGTGKTSLVQCGLANRFRDSDWFDITIRRGDNINETLRREIAAKGETPIEPGTTAAAGIESLYLDYLKPVYLIFDQFEELFILGTKEERREFFETAAQLLKTTGEGRGGNTVRGGYPSPRGGYSSPRGGAPCKLLFIMREEYLAWLYDFEKEVPQLFNHRFRVEPMNPTEVEGVIGGSCDAFGIGFRDREETVKGIIRGNREKKGIIGLPYLQVYLDRLYRAAEKDAEESGETSGVLFTPGLVEGIGKISDVMALFLDEQTEGVQKELEQKYREVPDEFVWQVLNCFVTVEGTNLPLENGVLYSRLEVAEEVLRDCLVSLERARILRLSENRESYEIAHDALALSIDDKRSVEEKTLLKVERLVKGRFAAYEDTAAFLAKGDLNYIEPYEKKLESRLEREEIDFIARSRKHVSKRRRAIIFGTVGVIVTLLLFAVFAGLQWKEALEQKRIAEKKTNEAIASKELAEEKTNEALESKEHADKKTREALASKKLAGEKTKEAKTSQEYAEEQKKIAEKKKTEASARRLAAIADSAAKEDPTAALRIAEKAWQLDKNQAVTDTIYKIYRENSFYKIVAKHEWPVFSVCFSPDGKNVLTGSGNGIARLWDLQDHVVQEFKWHKSQVLSVCFSPDGKSILTGSWDGRACLWDLQGQMVKQFNGHKACVSSVCF
ncbi:MAG: hypothetical protein GY757_34350, partial [bacterium]|nr:hypothetical protein [bacterium]